MTISQQMIEKLNEEEYASLLAYGDPTCTVVQSYYKDEYDWEWIGSLDSTTYPGLTFGYFDAL